MRLMGKCPLCGAEDSLIVLSGEQARDRVKCEKSGQEQSTSWGEFMRAEERRGNKLVVVEVSNWGLQVELFVLGTKTVEIPHRRLIAEVLNAALMLRFGLEVCFAAEGGVQGFLTDGPVELRNLYDKLGLSESEYRDSKASIRILRWYEKLLRLLFEDDLKFGRRRYGRAAILKLSGEPKDTSDALILLWVALARQESKVFANLVFQELKEMEKSLLGMKRFLAGLSDEDISRTFVPPPGMKELFGEA